ncbi:MAG: hypothetical protein K2N58_07120 [Treponemataceae bacterium]|nr:hypothetical protein [Treponemataceae bacterium]
MKKHLVVSMTLALSATQLFAFTPHINKGRIEEISVARACAEMKIPEAELKELNKNCFLYLDSTLYFPPTEIATEEKVPEIYKQTFEETTEVLYRVFIATKDEYAASTGKNYYNSFQKIYYVNGDSKGNLIFADYYHGDVDLKINSDSSYVIQRNLMPIIKNNKVAGIMYYGMETHSRYAHTDEYESILDLKSDHHTHRAVVFWSDDFSKIDLASGSAKSDIHIDCSKPLIDENDVFRYTIQNAFDKNPATSYVEDTKDDLMYISFGTKDDLRKIAIINGYAQNNDLYLKNNRVKKIGCDSYNEKEIKFEITDYFELQDSLLGYQIFEIKKIQNFSSQPSFYVEEIYKGVKYSDTCIAEVDYFYEKTGWLFGGVE